MTPNKFLSLEDILQLYREVPGQEGAEAGPKGGEEVWPYIRRKPHFLGMEYGPVQADPPNQNFLMWLMQKLRGGMWGNPDLPDQQLDKWMQQQMELRDLMFRGKGTWM